MTDLEKHTGHVSRSEFNTMCPSCLEELEGIVKAARAMVDAKHPYEGLTFVLRFPPVE